MMVILLMAVLMMTQPLFSQKHHTENGFRNPYPGFEERGLKDVFQWGVLDRIKGKKPSKPESYSFEAVQNDGSILQERAQTPRITWIGHSTLLIQVGGLNILTDPIWSERASPVQWAGPKRYMPPGVALDSLPDIDVIIISHDHYDHLDRGTIKKLGNSPLYLVPLGIGSLLKKWGISHFIELDWGESNKYNGMEFFCLPAQHFSGRSLNDRNRRLWASWLLRNSNHSIYFGGDSGYFTGYAEIGEKFGPIDIAALPIGAFRPAWFMGPVHMSPAQSIKALRDLRATIFIPIHWGTFDLADDLLDEAPALLKKEILENELEPGRFWILRHGETREENVQEK